MKFEELETLELKKSTSELEESLVSIVAILNTGKCQRTSQAKKSGAPPFNEHVKGEIIFGVKGGGSVSGQIVSPKTLRTIPQAQGKGGRMGSEGKKGDDGA